MCWILLFTLPQTLATHANSFGSMPQSQERQSIIKACHHQFADLKFEMIKQVECRGFILGLQLIKLDCQLGKHQCAPLSVMILNDVSREMVF